MVSYRHGSEHGAAYDCKSPLDFPPPTLINCMVVQTASQWQNVNHHREGAPRFTAVGDRFSKRHSPIRKVRA